MCFLLAILRHPETKIVPAGGNVPFVCTAQGEVNWFINDSQLSLSYENELEDEGFTFDPNYSLPYTNLTMTAPAKNSYNGTKIQCKAITITETAISDVAWLWIACKHMIVCLVYLQ